MAERVGPLRICKMRRHDRLAELAAETASPPRRCSLTSAGPIRFRL
jgi:hypothetical protein